LTAVLRDSSMPEEARMGIRLREHTKPEPRLGDKRRGKRMNSRVPVRLEWDAASGERVSVEAHTRVVNSYGCLVVLAQKLALEHRLVLTNMATSASNVAVIVSRGHQRPEGSEYGLELVGPAMDFWGLEL
jgi:hypothetical protein